MNPHRACAVHIEGFGIVTYIVDLFYRELYDICYRDLKHQLYLHLYTVGDGGEGAWSKKHVLRGVRSANIALQLRRPIWWGTEPYIVTGMNV